MISKRKYAANSKHVDQTGKQHDFQLRCLFPRRVVRSRVPEFAVYFCAAIPEVRGRTKINQPGPGFGVLCRFCCRKSGCAQRFSTFLRTSGKRGPASCFLATKNGFRDNIQLSRKHQRAVAGKPNNDPSLSSPHVESATTVSLRKSYRNVHQPNKATIAEARVRPQFPS